MDGGSRKESESGKDEFHSGIELNRAVEFGDFVELEKLGDFYLRLWLVLMP